MGRRSLRGRDAGRVIHHVLDYARKGWFVLPLNGKVPLTVHGVDDATRRPRDDPGLVGPLADSQHRVPGPPQTARARRHPRNGGDLAQLGAIPDTLTAVSGRGDGGRHLYFLRPAGQVVSTRVPKGIDLKVNGYMVMPPSLHPATGKPYVWEDRPVRALPPPLLKLLRPVPTIPRPMVRRGDSRGLVAFVATQVEGNRNAGLFWAACRAIEDGTLDELTDELVRAAIATGQTEHEARRTVASARSRERV